MKWKLLKKWTKLFFLNYDYGYFLEVQQMKLEEMYDFFNGPDTHIVDAKQIASEIKEALVLLDRVIEDDYDLVYKDITLACNQKQKDFADYHTILYNKLQTWWD